MPTTILDHIQILALGTAGGILAAFVFAMYWNVRSIDERMGTESHARQNMSGASNRRRSHRVRGSTVIQLKDESGRQVSGTAILHDMSPTGACFDSTAKLKRRQKIQTLIRSSKDGGILEMKAEVVWVRAGNPVNIYGVHFLTN